MVAAGTKVIDGGLLITEDGWRSGITLIGVSAGGRQQEQESG